jgi:hypothetical protein
VVVHGERELVPAASRAEAQRALETFTDAYNAADKAYDSSLDAKYVTGALGDIDAARLRAGGLVSPGGNTSHTPLELSDARFTIPRKAGWPRWFLADAAANKGGSARWLLVFTRDRIEEPFQVAYVTLVSPGSVPAFHTDAEGWAQAVDPDADELAVAPGALSRTYATYLQDGRHRETFADGTHTTRWREEREKDAEKPGRVTQYLDEPVTGGDYAPLALRTRDGGALVFFTTRHFVKQTAHEGARLPERSASVDALTEGEVRRSLTMEFVSNQAALDPPRATGDKVAVLGRIQGMVSAKGE